jgi:pimeloyl-ACP methyl ester carboxylesterase
MPALLSLIVRCCALAVLISSQASAGQAPPVGTDLQTLNTMLGFLRNRNAEDYAISVPPGIDEARYVEIGGIEQWITIRGEDRRNPVLLFLHGGPGDATNPWGYAVFRSWLQTFTVVQWDQRGSGRTLGRNGESSAAAVSVDRLVRDGILVAEHLRKSLGKDKIVLVGHSWGSMLGVFMVKARPDLFSAFVGTGQVADPRRNYAVAYDELLRKARRVGEKRAERDLEAVGPPPYPDGGGYRIQRRWANLFEGADLFISAMLGLALSAPGYTVRDVHDWGQGQMLSAERLVPETSALEAKALGGEFAIPVFVIQGAEDFTTPTTLAREFVSSIRAPRKEFAAIEGRGHFAVFTASEIFLKEIAARVLPTASRPSRGRAGGTKSRE